MKVIGIYDNGGKTADRYTIVFDELATNIPGETMHYGLGMSDKPTHPQGFCQHGEVHPDADLGKQIQLTDLPAECQTIIEKELADG